MLDLAHYGRRARDQRFLAPEVYSPYLYSGFQGAYNGSSGSSSFGYGHAPDFAPPWAAFGRESSNCVEEATRAQVAAQGEWEKAKEKFEEAKKKFEDCEKKLNGCNDRLKRAKLLGRA